MTRFNLRKLLLTCVVISFLLGSAILSWQHNRMVAERAEEFDRLATACRQASQAVVAELAQQDLVVDTFDEYVNENPNAEIDELVDVVGHADISRTRKHSSFLPLFFRSAQTSGGLDIHYKYRLRKSYSIYEPLAEVMMTSTFQSSESDQTVLVFRFRDTEANRFIAERVADDLSSQFEIEVEFELMD